MRLEAASLTNPGRKRRVNEDSIVLHIARGDPPWLFAAIADGMGGLEAGDIASQLAVQTLTRVALSGQGMPPEPAALSQGFVAAHESICQASERYLGGALSGTTLLAAVVSGSILNVSHVGDCRLYILHGGEMVQVTRDHTLVEEHLQTGVLTSEEARVSPYRHVITRFLASGSPPPVVDSFGPRSLNIGDRVLLCSDGLHGLVSVEEMSSIVSGIPPAEALTSGGRLITSA
jgi:protein phosphatase